MNIEEVLKEMEMERAPLDLKATIMDQIQTHKLLDSTEPILAPQDLKSFIMTSIEKKQHYEPVISKRTWIIIIASFLLTLLWTIKNPVGSNGEKLWQKYLYNIDFGWFAQNNSSTMNQWLPLAGTISLAIIVLLTFDQFLHKKWT